METETFSKPIEETNENPVEGETTETSEEEKAPDSEQETEEKKPEVSKEKVVTQKEFDKVYARLKVAEEKAKKGEAKPAETPKADQSLDVDAIVEVQQATKGLAPEEIAELRYRASVNKTPLSEARKDENFVLWQKAYTEKVAKENKAPLPSSTFAGGKSSKQVADMSDEEHQEFFEKARKKRTRESE